MHGQNLQDLITSLGPEKFYRKACELLNEKELSADDFSYYELADACGVLPKLRSVQESITGDRPAAALLRESNPGVSTHLFQVMTGELIGRQVIAGYENEDGFIGDQLVTVIPTSQRNQKLAGFTALAGPTEVAEGHAYEESTFSEKSITTHEAKQGRILSINEELIAFDQTGEINRRAQALGYYLRQERERTILRGVTDADASNGQFVYRPSGFGETLYATNGKHRNRIGTGNTTSSDFDSPIPLVDWTDIEAALHYRATQVRDDRIDGTSRPIIAPAKTVLVPETLRGTARSIVNATEVTNVTAEGEMAMANPFAGTLNVLSSPFIDEQAGSAASDWYLGDFARQFIWSEVWPVQTFLQRSESEAAFERDVVLRVKARYYGGISAVDTLFVTKITGE